MTIYGADFQQSILEGSLRSARTVIPIIAELVDVTSVIDVGCGTGVWLQAWIENHVDDILGLDDAGIPTEMLRVTVEQFTAVDLAHRIILPRRFDLAMSLEVAEHLPPERAETFVADLCQLADNVVFSAAIPGQGGTGHQNEQWPHYWAAIFAQYGYVVDDVLRPRIWNDDTIEFWYRQNIVLARKAPRPALRKPLPLVHPQLLSKAMEPPVPPTLGELVNELPAALSRWIGHYRRALSRR
jgi:SAM-dependent methyltransferase